VSEAGHSCETGLWSRGGKFPPTETLPGAWPGLLPPFFPSRAHGGGCPSGAGRCAHFAQGWGEPRSRQASRFRANRSCETANLRIDDAGPQDLRDEAPRPHQGHESAVNCGCLSRDGRWALSGGHDKTLRMWDVSNGRCVRKFQGHTNGVTSVCLSADGRWVLSGSKDKLICLWDASNERCVQKFEGHTKGVTSVCLSADGRWALSGSVDRTLCLWELDWEFEACNSAD
jgi:WD40 repeat protein